MDGQGYNNDDKWVEERIAKLSPPPGWKPDTDKAFESVMQRTRPGSLSRGLRLSMAAATVAAIVVIVALLPWKALWTPEEKPSQASAQADVKPAQSTPETPQAMVTGPVSPPSAASQTSKPETPASPATTTPPPQAPAPSAPQDGKQEGPVPFDPRGGVSIRRKKEPPIIAGTVGEPQKESAPSIAQAQTPQAPPSGVTPPIVIYQVQPEYTDEARQARVSGVVQLLAIVRVDGSVKVDKITQSLGYGLDESAAAAVEKWKFIPGKKDGDPVEVSTTIRIQFSLK